MLSVLSSPVGPLAASPDGSTSADDAVAELSQWYFQSVTNYLNDLFLGDRCPDSLFQIKSWVERYARKIEDLDATDVDPEVVTFGRDVAMSLHEIVSVLHNHFFLWGRVRFRIDQMPWNYTSRAEGIKIQPDSIKSRILPDFPAEFDHLENVPPWLLYCERWESDLWSQAPLGGVFCQQVTKRRETDECSGCNSCDAGN